MFLTSLLQELRQNWNVTLRVLLLSRTCLTDRYLRGAPDDQTDKIEATLRRANGIWLPAQGLERRVNDSWGKISKQSTSTETLAEDSNTAGLKMFSMEKGNKNWLNCAVGIRPTTGQFMDTRLIFYFFTYLYILFFTFLLKNLKVLFF